MKCGDCVLVVRGLGKKWCRVHGGKVLYPDTDCLCDDARRARLREELGEEQEQPVTDAEWRKQCAEATAGYGLGFTEGMAAARNLQMSVDIDTVRAELEQNPAIAKVNNYVRDISSVAGQVDRLFDLVGKHSSKLADLQSDVDVLRYGHTLTDEERTWDKADSYCFHCKRPFAAIYELHTGDGKIAKVCMRCNGTNTMPLAAGCQGEA